MSMNGNYVLSQVCQTVLCQKFLYLRKRRRELYVQIRTYKSTGRTSLSCLHRNLLGKNMVVWVLAKSHRIPAACGTAFLKEIFVTIEIFFFCFQATCIFSPCGLSLTFCAIIIRNLSFLFFSIHQPPPCKPAGIKKGKTLIYLFHRNRPSKMGFMQLYVHFL